MAGKNRDRRNPERFFDRRAIHLPVTEKEPRIPAAGLEIPKTTARNQSRLRIVVIGPRPVARDQRRFAESRQQPIAIARPRTQLAQALRTDLLRQQLRPLLVADEKRSRGGVDPSPVITAGLMRLRVSLGCAPPELSCLSFVRGTRRAVFISACEHSERFRVRVVLGDQLLKQRSRPFRRATPRQRQTLELAQPDVVRQIFEALPNDIVSEEGLAPFQQLFAEEAINSRCRAPRARITSLPKADEPAGVELRALQLRKRRPKRAGRHR